MHLFNLHIIYFSPTGGTKRAADAVASGIPLKPIYTDLSVYKDDYSKYRFSSNDVCIIAVPSFGGRIPLTASERLQRIKADNAHAILVCAYGNRHYDDTLIELYDIARSCGFIPVGATAAVTEHSMLRKYASGRPDADDEKQLSRFGFDIQKLINSGQPLTSLIVPGNSVYKHFNGNFLKPSANDKCTKCCICVPLCPVAAIPSSNPSLTNNDICMSCLRCIKVCPFDARDINEEQLKRLDDKLRAAVEKPRKNEFFYSVITPD